MSLAFIILIRIFPKVSLIGDCDVELNTGLKVGRTWPCPTGLGLSSEYSMSVSVIVSCNSRCILFPFENLSPVTSKLLIPVSDHCALSVKGLSNVESVCSCDSYAIFLSSLDRFTSLIS